MLTWLGRGPEAWFNPDPPPGVPRLNLSVDSSLGLVCSSGRRLLEFSRLQLPLNGITRAQTQPPTS